MAACAALSRSEWLDLCLLALDQAVRPTETRAYTAVEDVVAELRDVCPRECAWCHREFEGDGTLAVTCSAPCDEMYQADMRVFARAGDL